MAGTGAAGAADAQATFPASNKFNRHYDEEKLAVACRSLRRVWSLWANRNDYRLIHEKVRLQVLVYLHRRLGRVDDSECGYLLTRSPFQSLRELRPL